MAKKYVIQGARVFCQFGTEEWGLQPQSNPDVKAGYKALATQMDVTEDCLPSGFGICRSQYLDNAYNDEKIKSGISNIQLGVTGMIECMFSPAFLWQGVHEHVYISGYKGLLEDGWTMCQLGLGMVSLAESGQMKEDPVQQMSSKLAELEKVTDQYMKDNNIEESHRSQLLDSILLWNGYQAISWNYKSTEENRKFCEYMMEEEPLLHNYFERGLYLPNKDGVGRIDVTYFMGLSTKKQGGTDLLYTVSDEMIKDPAMQSAFFKAYGMPSNRNAAEALSSFLEEYENPGSVERWTDPYETILNHAKWNEDIQERYEVSVNAQLPYAARGQVVDATGYKALEHFLQEKVGEESAKEFLDIIKEHTKGGDE